MEQDTIIIDKDLTTTVDSYTFVGTTFRELPKSKYNLIIKSYNNYKASLCKRKIGINIFLIKFINLKGGN